MWPSRIIIVGGGTAGWLAALMLGDAARRAGAAPAITVVESTKFGTIGVGEGTTAVFRMMLKRLGLDEMEFLAATEATIKFGIRHRDWRRLGHCYDGPIDDPHLVAGLGGLPLLDAAQVAAGRRVGETHLFQHLIDGAKSPFALRDGRCIPAGPFHHAFHFDQALAGKYLKTKAGSVALIDDQVTGVQTGDAGIAALTLESGRRVEGDFFIDCSGFRRALIGPLGAEWVGYGDVLPVNRAMPFWIDIPEGEEIDPVTLAWAQGAGWMWKIPTATRYGCGYVYSDRHTTPDQAKTEIEQALGHEIFPRNDIKINAGRLNRSWIGNCVALGLASSFLEPLEATSIHGTVVQLMLMAALIGQGDASARFNETAARQVDDFRDFIRLHYVSERRDTPFWRDVAASHPAAVTEKVDIWADKMPDAQDFRPFPMGLPHVEAQLYTPVLDGLGLLSASVAQARLGADPRPAQAARALISEYRGAARQCIGHRAFLTSLHQKAAT